jgi:hypothetical protein
VRDPGKRFVAIVDRGFTAETLRVGGSKEEEAD